MTWSYEVPEERPGGLVAALKAGIARDRQW